MSGRESSMKAGILNKSWEVTQIKVFSRWCAKHLRTRKLEFETIEKDFSDGVKLINLLEVIGKEKMDGRWHAAPKNRFQKLENIQLAIHYITDLKKIKLIGIHPEDIVDCNLKLTLGLIWSCINKFVIEDISVEEATARDALLIWCKKNTQGYEGVNITNFTTSWSSGLAFCALINHFRPELLDYNALDKSNHTQNCITAFEACKELGITVFLDPEDLVDTTPDDKSVVTQASEFFHFFAGESRTIAMADKIKNTISIQKFLSDLKNDYEKQAQITIDAISVENENITNTNYERTVPGVKARLVDVVKFGRVGRPQIIELRATALRTWATLITNCKTHSRVVPTPKEGLEPAALDKAVNDLENIQAQTRINLTQELHEIENALLTAFDNQCETVINSCQDIRNRSISLNGTLREQRDILISLLDEANNLSASVDALQAPFDELCSYHLNDRSNNTTYSIQSELFQLISHIKRLIDQSNNNITEEENQAKILAYNEKAQYYVDECSALEASFSEIQGSIDERRDALIAKQEEITTKRNGVSNLNEDFAALEHEGLHHSIVNTPATITSTYSKLLTTAIVDTGKVFDEMVNAFDLLTLELDNRIKDLNNQANNLSGSFTEQRDTIESLTTQAHNLQSEIPTVLNESYDKICQFKLQWNIKLSPTDVLGSVEQLLILLAKLTEQNKSNLLKESNDDRINQYNQLAATYVQASQDFHETVNAIQNETDIAAKRSQYLEKQHELAQKREELQALNEPYLELERNALHMRIDATPSSISSYYASILSEISNALNIIYSEMVSNYDEKANAIADSIKELDNQQKSLSENLEERKNAISQLISQTEPIGNEIGTLNEPYEELTQYKLNYKAKSSPSDIQGMLEQLSSRLRHLEQNNEGSIRKANNAERVSSYNEKANALVDEIKSLEKSVSNVDGSNEEKQQKLYAKELEIKAKLDNVQELSGIYDDLERDELHLEIENTPSAIITFINSAISNAETIIQAIDKAIAAAKGLEISEEQLAEFRETFTHFDKTGDKILAPYELVACLTAMGDSITEEEAAKIAAKYSGGKSGLDFDSYVRFMLDRYSKKETPESTKEAFAAIAANQPVINDEQLARYFSPEDCEFMKTQMTPVDGGYDFAAWVDSIYA
ncbi:putative alpha-actinin [Tritrichomonas foetus]|uniref:Alpha-actinin n=1 Tax=Tritrichomonas foetus TaxID=1144522 RepID=A0A1J4KS32_9EUKA|nr:putative alpha-actinin [Tritrichomonas foetus]|eukprot:OHT12277.1 putative alpha-actinin [Tritrichomonas foetus]